MRTILYLSGITIITFAILILTFTVDATARVQLESDEVFVYYKTNPSIGLEKWWTLRADGTFTYKEHDNVQEGQISTDYVNAILTVQSRERMKTALFTDIFGNHFRCHRCTLVGYVVKAEGKSLWVPETKDLREAVIAMEVARNGN